MQINSIPLRHTLIVRSRTALFACAFFISTLCGCAAPQTAAPAPTPVLTPSPAPTATPAPAPTPIPTPFTMVWISDTQNLHGGHAPAMDAMADWILASRDELNTVCVLHTGDVVGSPTRQYQLDHARHVLSRIVNADIPLFVVSGNHDIGTRQNYGPYKEMIAGLMEDCTLYEDGEAGYMLLSAGGTDFFIGGMGYGRMRKPEAFAWLSAAYKAYPERVGILLSHSHMHSNQSLTTDGAIIQELLATGTSLEMVLCGHTRGAGLRTDDFDDDLDGEPDRTVNQLLANYQDKLANGGGWLRILTFYPLTRSISVRTYSPYQDDWNCFSEELEHFVLEDAF